MQNTAEIWQFLLVRRIRHQPTKRNAGGWVANKKVFWTQAEDCCLLGQQRSREDSPPIECS